MKNKKFTRWIEQIYATQEHELDCHQIQDGLPAYVDAINEGLNFDPTAEHKLIKHLNQCPDCNDTFEGLKFVTSEDVEADLLVNSAENLSSSAIAAD